jgi:L-iditol 2-dehydrogenase
MRAAELIAPQTFRLTEMEIEDPGPGEVQVRVEAVGVCGSDLHAYIEGAVGGRANVYPMLLGHEPAGRIVKAGAGVTGLAAGDRGALEPALYCYHCEFCLSGHHNVCANIRFLSNPGHPGFFRELVNLPVTNFLPIPGTMSYGEAALAEPLAIALHSLRLASIGPGESVAVIGAGPIGLLTIAALKAKQAGRIWAVERLAHRRELARGIGADVVLEPGEAVEEILRATGQRGVDCAIDCAAGEGTYQPGRSDHAQRRPRGADRNSNWSVRAGGCVGHEVQGADALQRAAIEPRDGRGVGAAGRARRMVCAAAYAHARNRPDR